MSKYLDISNEEEEMKEEDAFERAQDDAFDREREEEEEGWISVKDRMPAPFIRVLVTDGKNVHEANLSLNVKNTWEGWRCLNDEYYDGDETIAWRPLPEPPKY